MGERCQAPFCLADFDGNGVVQSKDLPKMLVCVLDKPSAKVAVDTYGTGPRAAAAWTGDLTGGGDGVRNNMRGVLRLLSYYYGVSYPKGGCHSK